MREILFRGQTRKRGQQVWMDGSPVDGKWVYGGIFQGTGAYSIIYGAEKESFSGADIGKHPVYTETVGQYTGLTDKNGTKIFEGDIVRFSYTGENRGVEGLAAVIFQNGKFCVEWGWHKDIVCLDGFANTTLEVIGNVHDNPELIGGMEDGEKAN